MILTGNNLNLESLYSFVKNKDQKIEIDDEATIRAKKSRDFLETESKDKVIYGFNTGFGPMASHIIGNSQLDELQLNLIRSHAVGMGNPIRSEYVLAAMVVRLNMFLQGYSGVSTDFIEYIKVFINNRIIPIVPEHGAVGTSGDLVQLAHIALALLGEGEVVYQDKKENTSDVLKKLKIKPYILKPKEGLSFINGTAVMTAISAIECVKAKKIIDLEIKNGAFAMELIHSYSDGISEVLQNIRPHAGQKEVARRLREILASSKLIRDRKMLHESVSLPDDVTEILQSVQEVYSFRCIPQILGPILDTIERTSSVVTIEMNSVTDNPIVDVEGGEFIHGGNFHGDYIASSIDQLKAAMVKLTMLSERRINFFLNKKVNGFLPPFLNLNKLGLNLGLQGLQFVATSTTAQSQSLAFPHHIHSISTNADNQDVVSMGTDAALFTSKVIDNAHILSTIEIIILAQAADYLNEIDKLSESSLGLHKMIRKHFEKVTDDRVLIGDLERLLKVIEG